MGVLDTGNEDLRSLRELTLYGLKGMAAYNKHANVLGYADTAIDAFLQKALAKTLDDSLSTDDLTSLVLETGSFGVKVMALLDTANTSTYGNPEITKVELGVRNNPAILISGHDLRAKYKYNKLPLGDIGGIPRVLDAGQCNDSLLFTGPDRTQAERSFWLG